MQSKTHYSIEVLENGSSRVVKSVVTWDCENPHLDKTTVYEDVVQTQIIEAVINPETRASTTATDPATVAAMRELLGEILKGIEHDRVEFDSFDDFSFAVSDRVHGWEPRIAKLLDGAS